jgi:hypothetical protein
LTTDGENTFGCLINGEKFFPRKEGPFDIPVKVQIETLIIIYLCVLQISLMRKMFTSVWKM